MPQFGEFTMLLAAALLTAGGALSWFGQAHPARAKAGVRLLLAAAAVAVASLAILMFLLVTHDYRVAYVHSYADRSMSLGFLVTAAWGGQQGSLLFWAVLQTLWTAGAALWLFRRHRDLAPVAVAVMAAVSVFFWLLSFAHSNPFALSGDNPTRGVGLNPLLRNAYMVAHPPTLFLGFSASAVPMAIAVAGLWKTYRPSWVQAARPWAMVAFGFLTVGNLLGMVWAYEELGWGGYWGWDPVENASLLPWITGTVLVHALLAQLRTDAHRRWAAVLAGITWILVVFSTFLTRTDIVQSVHTFAGATTGPYFLAAMAVALVGFTVLLWRRRTEMTGTTDYPVLSKLWWFEVSYWLFSAAAAFVGIATLWPFFVEVFRGDTVTMSPSFFNHWMVPIGMVLLAAIGACSATPWKGAAGAWRRKLAWFAGVGAVAGILAGTSGALVNGASGIFRVAPAVTIGLLVFTALSLLDAMRRSLLRQRRRRFAGQLVHLGMAVMYVGFTGAGFVVEYKNLLSPGEFFYVEDTKVTFLGVRTDTNAERESLVADLGLTHADGALEVVSPARAFYRSHPGQPTSEVAIRTGAAGDYFFILGEVDFNRGTAIVRALYNPLVLWVWLGGILMLLGTVIALVPTGAGRAVLEWQPRFDGERAAAWVYGGMAAASCAATGFVAGPEALLVVVGGWALATAAFLLYQAVDPAQ